MKLSEILSRSEVDAVTRKSDLRGAFMVATQWAIVAAILAAAAAWPNPFTIVLGTMLLGGRFLGFGVLAHECGHRSLFRTRWLNDFVGEYIVSPPGFGNNKAYMRGHLQHHRLAGTADDPDLKNYADYPVSRQRLRRKLTRDLTGRTGWRDFQGVIRGLRNLDAVSPETRKALLLGVGFNAALLLGLLALGVGWVYLMWIVAYLVVNPAISRIRQIAEHAAVPDPLSDDPRLNTRTVLTNPLARLVMAPHRVNYHLEHHMQASIPAYRLPRLHRLLRDKGFYDQVQFPRGYLDLLTRVTHAPSPA